MEVSHCPVTKLHERLRGFEPFALPAASRGKKLVDWKMELDDAPIFQHLYRSHRPRRHLEFGTWQGVGTTLCLESCDATVWTINLLEGESNADGSWAYYTAPGSVGGDVAWANRRETGKGGQLVQTDSLGFIGHEYLSRKLGHRVCQIYCDSTQWDASNYPAGFFDSVLIDGGHTEAVVTSDTKKAIPLIRPGGLVMWHDFCPDRDVQKHCSSVHGVHASIQQNMQWLSGELADLFWIEPSWILLGIKR